MYPNGQRFSQAIPPLSVSRAPHSANLLKSKNHRMCDILFLPCHNTNVAPIGMLKISTRTRLMRDRVDTTTMNKKSQIRAWFRATQLVSGQAIRDMRPFLVRQLILLCVLFLLLGLAGLIVPFFFRLPTGLFDTRAARQSMSHIAKFLFYGFMVAIVVTFVQEIRREMGKFAKERRGRRYASRPQQDAEVLAAFEYLRLVRLQSAKRYLAQSDTLTATPSFSQGVGSILDAGDTLTEYNETSDGQEADTLAMNHDRLMVSRDFQRGLEGAVKRAGVASKVPQSERAKYANG